MRVIPDTAITQDTSDTRRPLQVFVRAYALFCQLSTHTATRGHFSGTQKSLLQVGTSLRPSCERRGEHAGVSGNSEMRPAIGIR